MASDLRVTLEKVWADIHSIWRCVWWFLCHKESIDLAVGSIEHQSLIWPKWIDTDQGGGFIRKLEYHNWLVSLSNSIGIVQACALNHSEVDPKLIRTIILVPFFPSVYIEPLLSCVAPVVCYPRVASIFIQSVLIRLFSLWALSSLKSIWSRFVMANGLLTQHQTTPPCINSSAYYAGSTTIFFPSPQNPQIYQLYSPFATPSKSNQQSFWGYHHGQSNSRKLKAPQTSKNPSWPNEYMRDSSNWII